MTLVPSYSTTSALTCWLVQLNWQMAFQVTTNSLQGSVP